MPSTALATGYGAAEGLETMLTRMRADEEMNRRVQQDRMLAQHQQHMDQMSGRTQDRADRTADIANDAASTRLGIMKQIGDLLKASPQQEGSEQSPLIAGSKPDTSSGEYTAPPTGVDPGSGEASVSAPKMVSGFGRLNSPEGRTMMQMSGLNPNETFGSIPQPAKPKGPEDFNEEESWLNGQAKKLGHADYRAWMDADPATVQKAHKVWVDSGDSPTKPVAVQTLDENGRPVTRFVMPHAGDTYASKPPAQQITRADNARKVASHVGDILKEADALDKIGLMGPIAGRWSDFGAGKWGSAADIGQVVGHPITPQQEEQLSEFKTDVGLLKSGMAMVHGGARGGGSIEMNRLFDGYMNSNHMDVNHFRGATKSFQKWLTKYADLAPDYSDKSPDAGTGGGGSDPYADYLKHKEGAGATNPK